MPAEKVKRSLHHWERTDYVSMSIVRMPSLGTLVFSGRSYYVAVPLPIWVIMRPEKMTFVVARAPVIYFHCAYREIAFRIP